MRGLSAMQGLYYALPWLIPVKVRRKFRPDNGTSDVVGGVLPVDSTNKTVYNGHGPRPGVPPRETGGRREARE